MLHVIYNTLDSKVFVSKAGTHKHTVAKQWHNPTHS